MKLSEKDIEILKKLGHSLRDIAQIKEAIEHTRYTIIEESGKEYAISGERARKILGDDKYLSGIGRSAFHWSSVRENNGRRVQFDSSNLFM